MAISLAALGQIPSIYPTTLDNIVVKQDNIQYIRPDSIINSSVGEYYDTVMKQLLQIRSKLIEPVTTLLMAGKDSKRKQKFIAKKTNMLLANLLPMGVLVDTCSNYYMEHSVLRELNTRESNLVTQMDTIATNVCAKYPPKQDFSLVTSVNTQKDFLEERLIANCLYPWTSMGMKQVQLLIPTLTEDGRETILQICIDANTAQDDPMNMGYEFVYDILGTYTTLQAFKQLSTSTLIQQVRTPFTPFVIEPVLQQLDQKWLDLIGKAVQMSKTLYLEILKTGLKYDAIYATLGGFQSRFTVGYTLPQFLNILPNTTSNEQKQIQEFFKQEQHRLLPTSLLKDN